MTVIPSGDDFLEVFVVALKSAEGDDGTAIRQTVTQDDVADFVFEAEMTSTDMPPMLLPLVLSVAATNLHTGILMGLEIARRNGWTQR